MDESQNNHAEEEKYRLYYCIFRKFWKIQTNLVAKNHSLISLERRDGKSEEGAITKGHEELFE